MKPGHVCEIDGCGNPAAGQVSIQDRVKGYGHENFWVCSEHMEHWNVDLLPLLPPPVPTLVAPDTPVPEKKKPILDRLRWWA